MQGLAGRRRFFVTALLLALPVLVAGCGRAASSKEPITQAVPNVPSSATFGPLYPRINAYLGATSPDASSALRDTIAWARAHLEGFELGSCAQVSIVYDSEFAKIFGRTTLGVTLPWMQIYIRDGQRAEDPYLWKDASLFVSTVLHEFVHSIQRARQAGQWLGTGANCEQAHNSLLARRGTWNAGFDQLRVGASLSGGFAREDAALLYRWISPIERARDEVEAAITTVRWMHDHSDELSELTLGGANNWAYGVQFLGQLKTLAKSSCFSPDDDTYNEELHIYNDEIPAFVTEFQRYEADMKSFLTNHNVSVLKLTLDDVRAPAQPSGREGARCAGGALPDMPQYPIPIDGGTDSLTL